MLSPSKLLFCGMLLAMSVAPLRAEWLKPPDLRRAAAERLIIGETQPVIAQAEALVRAGRYAEARSSVADALKSVSVPSAERLKRAAAWVDEKQSLDELNAALAEKRWNDVARLGKKFLAERPNHSAAAAVRELLVQAATNGAN